MAKDLDLFWLSRPDWGGPNKSEGNVLALNSYQSTWWPRSHCITSVLIWCSYNCEYLHFPAEYLLNFISRFYKIWEIAFIIFANKSSLVKQMYFQKKSSLLFQKECLCYVYSTGKALIIFCIKSDYVAFITARIVQLISVRWTILAPTLVPYQTVSMRKVVYV